MNIHCNNGFNPGVWVNNIGNLPFNGAFTLSFDPILNAVPLNGVVPPTSISSGEVAWDLDNHMPGQSLLYQCHIEGPGVDYIGQEFPIALHLILYDDDDNVVYDQTWTLFPIVVCAYDPNDKYAEPAGYEQPHYVLAENEIEYRIRFQNTGNFPAEYITIEDTLDTETLDLSTFYPVFASHNFMTCLQPNGLVEFTFNEINLPDSTSDEPGSQGYVVYRIKPKLDVEPGTEINNTAYIYFEQNPPIITNTTWHTIYDCSELELLDGSTSEICESGNTSINIDYPYVESLEWSINDEEAGMGNILELNGLEPDNYTISLVASNPLCAATSEAFLLVHEAPQVSFTDSDAILTANEGFVSYQWYIDGEMIEGADEQIYTAEISGEYSVLVTDYYGCSSFSEAIYVLVTGLKEHNAGDIRVFPNPLIDHAILQFETEEPDRVVRILDLQAKQVSSSMAAPGLMFQIERNGLCSGGYMVEISTKQQKTYIYLIIQ